MATVHDVRAVAATLPRSTEHLVRDRVTFRVKQIVYAKLSRDETLMGLGFPKAERADLVASDDRFLLPPESDLRFNWVVCKLPLIGTDELEEWVCDAWALCVPKFLVRERLLRSE